jgi:hypothetical protein
MALMKKVALKDNYVQVPNSTAKAVEGELAPVSLQALGLIVNLWSYNVEKWKLNKTELYKRYGLNKKRSVSAAWDELHTARYIIEFKYRLGKSWEYVYLYRIKAFTVEEKETLLKECADEFGVSSISDFQQLKLGSSNCTVQNQHISNEKGPKDKNNETKNKEKLNHNPVVTANELILPMAVKRYIYTKNLMGFGKGTQINDSLNPLDIERFYNTSPYINPAADRFDSDFINDYEFLITIRNIVEKGPRPVENTIGILKSYVLNLLSFKTENSDYAVNVLSEPSDGFYEQEFLGNVYEKLGIDRA